MGHQMELFQVASGSWRYGCIECATSYKAMKRRRYGWISPMKSTKARAKEAAMKRELQRPLTIAGAVNIEAPVWFEHKENDGLLICSVSHDFKSYYRLELFGNEIPMTMDSRRYNVKWRLWASRPTDGERAAAKWEV